MTAKVLAAFDAVTNFTFKSLKKLFLAVVFVAIIATVLTVAFIAGAIALLS